MVPTQKRDAERRSSANYLSNRRSHPAEPDIHMPAGNPEGLAKAWGYRGGTVSPSEIEY
jgi:hypothetical protein